MDATEQNLTASQATVAEGVALLHRIVPPSADGDHRRQARLAVTLVSGSPGRLTWNVGDGVVGEGEVRDGDIFIWPAGADTSARWERRLEHHALVFAAEYLDRVSADSLRALPVTVTGQARLRDPLIEQIIRALWGEMRGGWPCGPLFRESMVASLAVHVLHRYGGRSMTYRSGGLSRAATRRVLDVIHGELDTALTLDRLAAAAHMSACHFARRFKLSLGMPPHQYVIRQRVERAKVLIRRGGLSLSQVAAEVGFADQSHLGRHFRRLTGVSPSQFR